VISALRKLKRSPVVPNAFVRSALNNLSHGVVMMDPQRRIGVSATTGISDLRPGAFGPCQRLTGRNCWSCNSSAASSTSASAISIRTPAPRKASSPNCPADGRFWSNTHCKRGSVATHEDCSEQRKLSRQLASTKAFLESMLDNVPVCVAAKSIEDGVIFLPTGRSSGSRAFPATTFSAACRRDFPGETAAGSLRQTGRRSNSSDGQFRNEIVVQRGFEEACSGQYPRDRA